MNNEFFLITVGKKSIISLYDKTKVKLVKLYKSLFFTKIISSSSSAITLWNITCLTCFQYIFA